jgi:PAS domain S-box-containing protein
MIYESTNVLQKNLIHLVNIVTIVIAILLYKIYIISIFQQVPTYALFVLPIIYASIMLDWRYGMFTTVFIAILIQVFLLKPLGASIENTFHLLTFVMEGIAASSMISILHGRMKIQRIITQSVSLAESYYRGIVEGASDVIIIVQSTGEIIDLNESAEKLTGIDSTTLDHVNIKDYIHPDDLKLLYLKPRRPSRPKRIKDTSQDVIELRFRRFDGAYITAEITISPMSEDNFIVITLRDVTKRREEEAKIFRTASQLDAVVKGSMDAIVVKDCNLNYVFANPTALEFLGCTDQSEVLDKSDYDFYPKEVADEMRISDRDVIDSGQRLVMEETVTTENSSRILHTFKSPLFTSDNNIEGVIVISRDITHRKKMDLRKDEFITVASHELKTPLTSVKGYVQLLERNVSKLPNNEALLKYTQKAGIYLNRLNYLVSELLDVTKMQAGKLAYYFKIFDFNEMVTEAVEGARYISDSHDITVTGSVSRQVCGDKYRLEQVVSNLLSNAIKYSPQSDRIVVRIEEIGENVQVAVTDFGGGIPDDKKENIFEKFYRTDEAQEVSGLGIGLYIAKEIVERHNGKIWFISEVGKGSTFYFRIPIEKAEEKKNG